MIRVVLQGEKSQNVFISISLINCMVWKVDIKIRLRIWIYQLQSKLIVPVASEFSSQRYSKEKD